MIFKSTEGLIRFNPFITLRVIALEPMAAPGSTHPPTSTEDPFAELAERAKQFHEDKLLNVKKEICEKVKVIYDKPDHPLTIDMMPYVRQGIQTNELIDIKISLENIGLKVSVYDGTEYDNQWTASDVRVFTWKVSLN